MIVVDDNGEFWWLFPHISKMLTAVLRRVRDSDPSVRSTLKSTSSAAIPSISSLFLTQRSKSKFVFVGPSKYAETLFKHIAPEQIPVQYGGLSKESDTNFTFADAVNDVTIKPTSNQTIEIPASKVYQLFASTNPNLYRCSTF